MAIYDPVGFLAPILINLKLLFQEICLLDIGWDEHISNLKQKWFSIVKLLSTYADFKIKQRYFIEKADDPVESIYLHGYSDAVEKAFAACIYIQAITRSRNVQVSFVTAKSRVNTIRKKLSVPKLELLGNFV